MNAIRVFLPSEADTTLTTDQAADVITYLLIKGAVSELEGPSKVIGLNGKKDEDKPGKRLIELGKEGLIKDVWNFSLMRCTYETSEVLDLPFRGEIDGTRLYDVPKYKDAILLDPANMYFYQASITKWNEYYSEEVE